MPEVRHCAKSDSLKAFFAEMGKEEGGCGGGKISPGEKYEFNSGWFATFVSKWDSRLAHFLAYQRGQRHICKVLCDFL